MRSQPRIQRSPETARYGMRLVPCETAIERLQHSDEVAFDVETAPAIRLSKREAGLESQMPEDSRLVNDDSPRVRLRPDRLAVPEDDLDRWLSDFLPQPSEHGALDRPRATRTVADALRWRTFWPRTDSRRRRRLNGVEFQGAVFKRHDLACWQKFAQGGQPRHKSTSVPCTVTREVSCSLPIRAASPPVTLEWTHGLSQSKADRAARSISRCLTGPRRPQPSSPFLPPP